MILDNIRDNDNSIIIRETPYHMVRLVRYTHTYCIFKYAKVGGNYVTLFEFEFTNKSYFRWINRYTLSGFETVHGLDIINKNMFNSIKKEIYLNGRIIRKIKL